ncbi:hypothetical protein QYF36_015757 [Acer negundo]|nr:hypothetical protein QYF36_015757 [Acer negundo]
MGRIVELLTTIVQHQMRVLENTIKCAHKVGATNFDGTGDPDSASTWLNELERVFGVMRCTDEQKVSFAIFLLKEKAYDWCASMQRRTPKGIAWDDFKRQFHDRYYPCFYPRFHQDLKRVKFFRLGQRSMTIEEYEKKFI